MSAVRRRYVKSSRDETRRRAERETPRDGGGRAQSSALYVTRSAGTRRIAYGKPELPVAKAAEIFGNNKDSLKKDDPFKVLERILIGRYDKELHKEAFIGNGITELEEVKKLLSQLQGVPAAVRRDTLKAVRRLVEDAKSPAPSLAQRVIDGDAVKADSPVTTSWVERTKAKAAGAKPAADVELPDHRLELWADSPEKAQWEALQRAKDKPDDAQPQEKTDKGKDKLDAALIAFTKRVYGQWMKLEQGGGGMAVSEIARYDAVLYDELKAARNRMNGRKEKFPFPTIGERNRVLIEKIHAGELDPPADYRSYVSLNVIAKRQGRGITK